MDRYYRASDGFVFRDSTEDKCPQVAVIDPCKSREVEQLRDQIQNITGISFSCIDLERALQAYMNPVVKPDEPKGIGAIAQYLPPNTTVKTFIRLKNGEWVGAHAYPTISSGSKKWRDFPDDVKIIHEGYHGSLL